MDVGNSDKWTKTPPCTWSAIPPPELRGEAFEDLSTNGGFFSFGILFSSNNKRTTSLQAINWLHYHSFDLWFFIDISSRHVEGKRLDKTVWNLLNFNTYVRNHVKVTMTIKYCFITTISSWKFKISLTNICSAEHERFHSQKDEETYGKFGSGTQAPELNHKLIVWTYISVKAALKFYRQSL